MGEADGVTEREQMLAEAVVRYEQMLAGMRWRLVQMDSAQRVLNDSDVPMPFTQMLFAGLPVFVVRTMREDDALATQIMESLKPALAAKSINKYLVINVPLGVEFLTLIPDAVVQSQDDEQAPAEEV